MSNVKSVAQGATIVSGGERLPLAEEKALNLLLARAGGFEGGAQLYKLGWAMEDNQTTFDNETGNYKYNPNKVPVCIEPNQASYHLLSWAPPFAADMQHEAEFLGEDLSNGTYNCIMHFLTPEGKPINPTASLIEHIIPVLKDMHEIATATRKGFVAERNLLRKKKIDEWKAKEAKAQKDYETHAEFLLEDKAPAFEGNPTSFPGAKGKSFSDLRPGERRVVLTDSDIKSSDLPLVTRRAPQPAEFAFSARTPKKVNQ